VLLSGAKVCSTSARACWHRTHTLPSPQHCGARSIGRFKRARSIRPILIFPAARCLSQALKIGIHHQVHADPNLP
jgi:hypothetical protein